jgi:hypothetical protein
MDLIRNIDLMIELEISGLVKFASKMLELGPGTKAVY